ncbi:MAG: sigma-70 family RNA polymerase sigma factor [Acidobacteriota bacterium]
MGTALIESLPRSVVFTGQTSDSAASMDSAALVRELVRTGDDDLFQVLVERFRDRVFRLVVSMLGPGDEAEAEDVTQEVFVLVYRKLETFRHDSEFSTWLFRMAKNRAIDRLRTARMRHVHVGEEKLRSLPLESRICDPEEVAAAGERRAAVLEQVNKLPALQRTIVYLYYWMGSGVTDIAELLDMNVQTVKSHLHRARRRLASELESAEWNHD